MEYKLYSMIRNQYRIYFQGGIKMNKTEFIAAIAEEAGLSKTDAAKAEGFYRCSSRRNEER